MNNALREIKKMLYRLKRRYGEVVTLYVPQSTTPNLQTGSQTRSFKSYRINKAIPLPEKQVSRFVYDLAFIAANRNFTQGAYFEQGTRQILIDRADLPSGVTITQDCVIHFQNQRYEVSNISEAEVDAGYLVTVKRVQGSTLAFLNETVVTSLELSTTSAGVKE